jgi:hypothetical protein
MNRSEGVSCLLVRDALTGLYLARCSDLMSMIIFIGGVIASIHTMVTSALTSVAIRKGLN